MTRAIVIVGSTCSGKTTLVQAIRDAALDGVDIPRRYVTRVPRPGDIADEASLLTAETEYFIHWTRTLAGQTERYAFAPPVPGKLAVYSANNAILDNVQPAGALADALVIGVDAPADVRAQRLHVRSPELCRDRPEEAHARLAEGMPANVHRVIENYGPHEQRARQEIVEIVIGTLRAFECGNDAESRSD
jgi:ribose 1,5-bisphosphokinase PhnN